ncbi:cytochrome b/b6 domain-containing protein [Burkholderia dolosa]|uniref:Cytochrome b/b6 domain-containing protein n=1 Tax=Burkholderia dolosa TaxID=152500 RepID=A0A892IGS3_9BURK|nr:MULTISPECIES: cytochrome b/b6 domain-containing protein [Burkholderia]AKE05936.1 cytochrome B561 [Burkholderia cepacia]AJY10315.1 prokaryotic cytochrome b561 family protein [Burkholderia dolosa AU0158]AYZ93732.1 cytochrome B [Burkholderia dolosa]EAY70545.1 Cytochrome B561 [Burkholderia dolosa AU0158]ETP62548.1 cytochrome B561 [Burkholderia dolosa PC543]
MSTAFRPYPLRPSAAPVRYDRLSRAMHWIFAAIILYTMVAGVSLHFIAHPAIWRFVSTLNMSLATCLIVLFPVRYVWSFFRRTPPETRSIPPQQRSLAHLVHSLIYALVAVVLVSGYMMVPDGYLLFWTIFVKTPFSAGPVTDHWFAIHKVACYSLAALVVAHVAAALKHHFLAGNDVLKRML